MEVLRGIGVIRAGMVHVNLWRVALAGAGGHCKKVDKAGG